MSMSISPINAAASWWTPQASQSVTNGQASSTSAPNTSDLASVFQQFSVDPQSMLAQATPSATGATTASNATLSPSGSTSQPTAQQPGGVPHHHHHHGGGSAESAANQFVSQIAQLVESGSASSNSRPTTGSALAADVVQALQRYGAFGSQQSTSTVSTTA